MNIMYVNYALIKKERKLSQTFKGDNFLEVKEGAVRVEREEKFGWWHKEQIGDCVTVWMMFVIQRQTLYWCILCKQFVSLMPASSCALHLGRPVGSVLPLAPAGDSNQFPASYRNPHPGPPPDHNKSLKPGCLPYSLQPFWESLSSARPWDLNL